MRRFLVTATLKEGSEDGVRAILSKGPPFQLPETSLERHFVFLTSNELVFVFEGARAEEEVARLLSDSGVLGQASELGSHRGSATDATRGLPLGAPPAHRGSELRAPSRGG